MGHTKSFIGFVFQGRVELEKVSISPTFYDQLSQTKVFWKAFLYLEFGFVFICRKNIGKKAAHKMLANLIKGVNFTDIFTSSFFMHSFVRQLLIKIFNFSDSESNLDTAGVTLETSLRCDSAPVMPSSRQYSTGTGNRRLKSRQKSQDLPLFHCPQVTTRQYKCPSIFTESNPFQGRISWIVFCIEVFSSIVTQTSL